MSAASGLIYLPPPYLTIFSIPHMQEHGNYQQYEKRQHIQKITISLQRCAGKAYTMLPGLQFGPQLSNASELP